MMFLKKNWWILLLLTAIAIIMLVVGNIFYKSRTTKEAKPVIVSSNITPTAEATVTPIDNLTITTTPTIIPSMTITPSPNLRKGEFINYDASKIKNANDGKVILLFCVDWSPPCVDLEKDIKANIDKIPSNTSILRVDYDRYEELKYKYAVTYQHTLVQVDAKGNMIKKWAGSATLNDIVTQIR